MTIFYQENIQLTTENSMAFQCNSPRRFCAAGDDHKPGSDGDNVLEKESVNLMRSPPLPSSPVAGKRDPGGIGFMDEMGGGVDGWMSCTESLGFESSDERLVDGQIDNIRTSSNSHLGNHYDQEFYHWRRSTNGEVSSRWREVCNERREAKKFPPPLSSLNIHGQPSFFLLPERKDGRLELTEVRIRRPEILRASRQGGRLRLHLLGDLQEDEEEEEEVTDETGVEEQQELTEAREKEEEQELEKGENGDDKNQGVEVEVEEERGAEEEWVEVELEDSEGETNTGKWKFPVNGGEWLTRCHELVNRHHPHHNQHHPCHSNHHHLHAWRQHCLTTG